MTNTTRKRDGTADVQGSKDEKETRRKEERTTKALQPFLQADDRNAV
jgi:hypothetical protein